MAKDEDQRGRHITTGAVSMTIVMTPVIVGWQTVVNRWPVVWVVLVVAVSAVASVALLLRAAVRELKADGARHERRIKKRINKASRNAHVTRLAADIEDVERRAPRMRSVDNG